MLYVWMILKPLRALRCVHLVYLSHLQPAEQGVEVRSARYIPPPISNAFSLTEPSEEQEHISRPHALFGKVFLR
ncbi:hypothetical protein LV28_10695 [Pandoraea pnomenusa]|nr:hypothetical protein LV28_10695 [Pandoraea pnomenusa]